MSIKVGDLVRMTWQPHANWPSDNKKEREVMAELPTFIVVGKDKIGRIWLTAEDDEYDGYDADVILFSGSDEWWEVQMADDRTSIPWNYRIKLEVQ